MLTFSSIRLPVQLPGGWPVWAKLQSGSITVTPCPPSWLYKATRYLAHFPRKEQVMKLAGAAIIKDAPEPELARLF